VVTGGLVLGVDVGGNKLRAALADEHTIVAELTEPTRQGSPREVIGQMVGIAGRLTAQIGRGGAHVGSAITAVGISVPTYVDQTAELLGLGPGVPGLAGADVMRLLQAAFGVPVVVENDANLAALAEGAMGAAVGCQNYVAVLFGVGVGMGIVMDGELRRGWRGRAGEIGWLPLAIDRSVLDPTGPTDFESIVASASIRKRVTQAALADRASSLSTARSFEDATRAAQAGDATATRVVREEARTIATGLGAVIAVLDPELMVLCGELGSLPALADLVRPEVNAIVSQPPQILSSKLGQRGELMGAIVAARERARATRTASTA
jgi:glucokinase